MKFVLLSAITAVLLLAAAPGIRPRADVADYPAHEAGAEVTLGAAVVPANEVKKIFATDLNRGGYVVVEVGVYPDSVKDADVNPADFTLTVDPHAAAMRTVDAAAAAAAIGRVQEPGNPTMIHGNSAASVALGGSNPNDPFGRRTGGINSRTASGPNGLPPVDPPATTDPGPSGPTAGPRPADMEQELWTKSLPDGITRTPVAGYLYFPRPSGKTKNQPWELTWDGPAGRVRMTIQTPPKK
jgi:hypothetical protein